MAASEQTEQYARAMDEAIASAARAEGERDVLQTEVASLKRKYEPDTGILIDKLLKLTDDHSASFMRVLVRTGEYLLLELVPSVRNNGNVPMTKSLILGGGDSGKSGRRVHAERAATTNLKRSRAWFRNSFLLENFASLPRPALPAVTRSRRASRRRGRCR